MSAEAPFFLTSSHLSSCLCTAHIRPRALVEENWLTSLSNLHSSRLANHFSRQSFPSPFYILDEVEAALDDANLHRMINLLNYVRDDAQFIIVTHQQQTMHAGDVLYGVTMEPGSGSRIFIKTKSEFENLISNEGQKNE